METLPRSHRSHHQCTRSPHRNHLHTEWNGGKLSTTFKINYSAQELIKKYVLLVGKLNLIFFNEASGGLFASFHIYKCLTVYFSPQQTSDISRRIFQDRKYAHIQQAGLALALCVFTMKKLSLFHKGVAPYVNIFLITDAFLTQPQLDFLVSSSLQQGSFTVRCMCKPPHYGATIHVFTNIKFLLIFQHYNYSLKPFSKSVTTIKQLK